jgi:hypothetical protein
MSEPTRWRDDGPDDVRALLRGATRTREPSAEERARGRRRLAHATGLLAVAGATAWLQGAALGAGLGVLVVGVTYVAPWGPATLERAPVAAAPTVVGRASAAPEVMVVASSAAVVPATASAAPAAVRGSAAPAVAVASGAPAEAEEAPAPRRDSLAEEAALLERARAALGPNPAEALALTEVHAAQFPAGKLAMEREIVALDALRRLGRSAEVRTRGEALLARVRGGLYEERIQRLMDRAR